MRGGFCGGIEGEASAGDGLWGCPCATEGEGAVSEGFEVAGREVGEGRVGVGDKLVEDVRAKEKSPERAQMRRSVEGL